MIKSNNFVVLDIENPNSRGNSICAIGMLIIEDGTLIRKEYSLINPEDRFDRTNSEITGITESMVLDSPTFKDYWPGIGALLSDSVIIGHNIKYDLSVLSKALYRYDMPVPAFQYVCTLELSRSLLSASSYKLSSLLGNLGISYNAHNALADAEAAFTLLKYLNSNYNLSSLSINKYEYTHSLKKSLDSRLASNINDLYGIIQGINYDGIVDSLEIQLLQKWIDDNSKYREFAIFNRILNELTLILEDGIVTEYERYVLCTLVDSVTSSKIYSDSTLGIQVLEGLIKGILSDHEINNSEILSLQCWLNDNDYLKGVYPYDKVLNAVEKILADGIITDEERVYLSQEFDEILNPSAACEALDLTDKTFCLTGDFKTGTKSEIEKKLSAKGAIKKSSVSGKLDYLFVGGLGSEAWKYGNIGGKIAKAQELQEKGNDIKIISEDNLISFL
jgi:DNA polymerase III subunit epsilon